MKIKAKLNLGVGVLFTLILILGIVAAAYVNVLKTETENILVANYNSIAYSKNILFNLQSNEMGALSAVEKNVQSQEKNVTEQGEKETTSELRSNFEEYKKNTSDKATKEQLSITTFRIMDMNMQAIQIKSSIASKTAGNAVFWILITATLCFIIAFTLLINLPSNIADPIKELTNSIKQISEKNYKERLNFKSNSEFGQLASSFNTLAEKLEEYDNTNLAKVMTEKKRIDILINNMQNPVFGLDENLNILFVNEEAVKIIGMTRVEIIGKNTLDLALKNDLIRSLISDINSPVQLNSNKIEPLKIYSGGKESYFEKEILHLRIVPTGEEHEKLMGHVIILKNITEFKELDFAKNNFIATVSHEFKTPISAIKMSLLLLEKEQVGTLNEEQGNLVKSINEDINRLLKITGELLNMTQIESGNIQLSILPVDIKEIIEYASNAIKTQAKQKQINIKINMPNYVPPILADSEKTAWVLTNLISNAVRYSYENSDINVQIKVINKKVMVSVTDTGQGIPPQYLPKIFDRYFRVPGTKKEGTGLGLAISKEFMMAQGGMIDVESELGAGSKFTISLNTLA